MKLERIKKKTAGHKLNKSPIFHEIMRSNKRRMLKAFLIMLVIANVAVTAIKFTGKGSAYLTYWSIFFQISVIALVLILSEFIIRKRTGTVFSGYTTITSVVLCLWIFQFFFYGASELFAANYITVSATLMDQHCETTR